LSVVTGQKKVVKELIVSENEVKLFLLFSYYYYYFNGTNEVSFNKAFVMRVTISQAAIIKKMPITTLVSILLASDLFAGTPPEVIYLKPAKAIITTEKKRANFVAKSVTLFTASNKSLKVQLPYTLPLTHSYVMPVLEGFTGGGVIVC
jgi:hypothetical protein